MDKNFIFGLKIVGLFVIAAIGFRLYWSYTGKTPAKLDAATPAAGFDTVAEQPAVSNTPITEAAYHQTGDYSPAFGPETNTGGSEVLTLQ